MNAYHDEIMEDVMQRKAELLEMHGGIEGLHKNMDADRLRLEREGWKFIDPVEFREQNFRRQLAENL
jgi:hypothetical protein